MNHKRINYPITDLATLREERAFFLRHREVLSHHVTFANRDSIFLKVDADLAFNARLIAQAERDAELRDMSALGHLATAGAWLA